MKKIIVIIVILLVCFLIALGILVMQNQKSTSKTQSYKISLYVDKDGFKDVFLNDSKDLLPEKDINQYLNFFLNSPGDLIWFSCVKNYRLKSYASNTGENIIFDSSIGVGLELEKYIYKHIYLICEKYE